MFGPVPAAIAAVSFVPICVNEIGTSFTTYWGNFASNAASSRFCSGCKPAAKPDQNCQTTSVFLWPAPWDWLPADPPHAPAAAAHSSAASTALPVLASRRYGVRMITQLPLLVD